MKIDRAKCLRAFEGYVAAYDPADPKIALKVEHTYRVAELAEGIAADEGLAAEDVDLAWLCGLLHDIGRFEQVRRYGTFSDARSESHAALGVHVLLDEGHLWDFVDREEGAGRCTGGLELAGGAAAFSQFVATVVGTHSDFRLPEGLDARTRMFCDILRDADKVDILKAVGEADISQVLDVPLPEILAGDISPAVRDAFYSHRTVKRTERSGPTDIVVSYPCLLFEVVHPYGLRVACEQGYVWKLLGLPFTNPATAAEVSRMADHLRGWLTERTA